MQSPTTCVSCQIRSSRRVLTSTSLAADKYIGPLAASSVKKVVKEVTEEQQVQDEKMSTRPPLDHILSLHDFEAIAKEVMKPASWAYYSSGSDDEITMVGDCGTSISSFLLTVR